MLATGVEEFPHAVVAREQPREVCELLVLLLEVLVVQVLQAILGATGSETFCVLDGMLQLMQQGAEAELVQLGALVTSEPALLELHHIGFTPPLSVLDILKHLVVDLLQILVADVVLESILLIQFDDLLVREVVTADAIRKIHNLDRHDLELRIGSEQLRSINKVTGRIDLLDHDALVLGVRDLVAPLAVGASLPAGSQPDGAVVLASLLHLLCGLEIRHCHGVVRILHAFEATDAEADAVVL